MANTLEIIIRAIDQASKIIAQVETKTTASTAAMVKGFEDVGLASSAVDKRLGEYGAAVNDVARAQNKLKEAQIEAQDAAQKLAQAQKNLAENTDPSRAEALNRELVKSQVELDNAGKKVQDLSTKLRTGKDATEGASGAFSKMQATLITVNQAIDLIGRGFGYAKQIIDATVGTTMAYSKEVRELSTNLGITAEETSKIIQASDDYGISVQTVTDALQMAVKRGFAPNIDTLAKLADEYKNIQDPVQRAARLSDVFGRNWTALTPILSAGGAAIRDAANEAEKLGLVLNQKDVQAARNLEIQIDNLNDRVEAFKINVGKSVIPGLVDFGTALNDLISRIDGTEQPLKTMQWYLDHLINLFGKDSDQVKLAQKAIEEYRHTIENTPSEQFASGLRKIADESRQISSSGLVDYILAEESGMKRAADAAQALADKQAALLTVGIAGALKNEAKSFGQSQEELRKRLKETEDELASLQRQQGTVKKTTVENKMSANELALAEAQLAAMEQKAAQGAVANATGHKQSAAEQQKAAQAAANAASAHQVLAAQIAVQRDKINEANTATSSYVDNSKRIKELKGQYDDINKEIAGNVAAHEDATKRILYGYAEQLLAREGLTKAETDALNKLAVQFGIKSQDDVNAFEAIRNAADRLAKDENIDVFVDKVTGRLTILEQSAQALADKGFAPIEHAFIKAKDNIEKYGSEPVIVKTVLDTKKAKTDATALVTSKEMKKVAEPVITPIKADTNAAITSLNWLDRYGIQPLITEYDALIVRAQTFNAIVAATPTIPGTTGGTGGEPIRPPGAGPVPFQKGGSFVVPPGYSNDRFPMMVSSGERVTVTPAGQRGNIPPINITQTFNGAQSSPEQYKSIMYEVITDVIKQAVQ